MTPFDRDAAKRPANLTLNGDLVARARRRCALIETNA